MGENRLKSLADMVHLLMLTITMAMIRCEPFPMQPFYHAKNTRHLACLELFLARFMLI